MAPHSDDEVLFRDYPVWLWTIGLAMAAVSLALPGSPWAHVLLPLLGGALVAFPAVLTVSVDRRSNTLSLHYRSLVHASTQILPLAELAFARVARDWEGEPMYRVELVTRSGRVIPLPDYYSAWRAPKERRALRLMAAIEGAAPSEHDERIARRR